MKAQIPHPRPPRLRPLLLALAAVAASVGHAAGTLPLAHRPLLAGKASLVSSGFEVSRTLGTALFAPELRMPVELVYDSSSEMSGPFGFGWRSPQLESSVRWDRDGVLWTTPWGERVKFFPKRDGTPKNAVRLAPIEEAKRGRGLYAPYSDWEAAADSEDYARAKSITVSGRNDFRGWRLAYGDGRLARIETPNGTEVRFEYDAAGNLLSVSSRDVRFVELGHSGGRVVSLRLNGVPVALAYSDVAITVLPKTVDGVASGRTVKALSSVRIASLDPEAFAYANGYLASCTRGRRVERLAVQTETPEDRIRNLRSKDAKNGVAHSGRVAGRLLSDADFEYSYSGGVQLRNRAGDVASYSYDMRNGIFRTTDFTGRSTTTYYFMRHDVAYLGRVRKVVDECGRDLVAFRYDRKTGKPVRVTDRLGNKRILEYDGSGNCTRLSRRADWSLAVEPVRAFGYDRGGRLTSVSELDADGRAVRTVSIAHDRSGRTVRVSDGRRTVSVTRSPAGFPTAMRDDLSSVTFAYDRYNRPVSTTDPYGVATVRTYADHGGIAKIERRDGSETLSSVVIGYDGSGLPVSVTDRDGRTTACDRDALGRVIGERYADGAGVAYAYDALGRLASVVDENGHEIRFGWDRLGLSSRTTAAGQVTDYVRDDDGLVAEIVSSQGGGTDRKIRRAYDEFDRVTRVDYGGGETETFAYDRWGRLSAHARGSLVETYAYDHFGRLVEKDGNGIVTTYAYDAWGNRTLRVTRGWDGSVTSRETRSYDRYGRLVEIAALGTSVRYRYDARGRIMRQTVDGTPIDFVYTRYGRLAGKYLGGRENPDAAVEYEYSKSGRIVARTANGVRQTYEYDRRGRLLAVREGGAEVERYAYDAAGNVVRKTVRGRTTDFTFDAANQLVSSTCGGATTGYAYDAAGRLVREGNRAYRYGYLDKVLAVTEGERKYTYDYHPDGQLARADYGGGRTEEFEWDGLALVRRGGERFVNEPHIGGGNPVISSRGVTYLNDALGTTVGAKRGARYSAAALTAFGEGGGRHAFFTGKPLVEGLGRAFLMRNYRADLAKWQTADPLGYPDGWNQLAYCNNDVTQNVDFWGALVMAVYSISRKEFTVTDDQTGRTITVHNSISGDNILGHQWVSDVGPIPIGVYTILDYGKNYSGWYELWRDDNWFDDFTTGPGGVERGNFRLHPGTFSAGCITLPKDSNETRSALNLIGGTKTEIIYPASIYFEEKIKFGTLTVIE